MPPTGGRAVDQKFRVQGGRWGQKWKREGTEERKSEMTHCPSMSATSLPGTRSGRQKPNLGAWCLCWQSQARPTCLLQSFRRDLPTSWPEVLALGCEVWPPSRCPPSRGALRSSSHHWGPSLGTWHPVLHCEAPSRLTFSYVFSGDDEASSIILLLASGQRFPNLNF